MTYKEQQLQNEIDMLYNNLIWRMVRSGELSEDWIDDKSHKSYGMVEYRGINVVNFPTPAESSALMEAFNAKNGIEPFEKFFTEETL